MVGSLRRIALGGTLVVGALLTGCYESHLVSGNVDCEEQCVAEPITWGYVGGLAAYEDESTLTPCRTFTHTRTPLEVEAPPLTCTNTLPSCATGPSVSVEEVEAALADPDVQAALAMAPVLYGVDTRPVDGQIFRVNVGADSIGVGSPCGPEPDCDPIPAGVQALVDLLSALTMAEISQEPCLSILLEE